MIRLLLCNTVIPLEVGEQLLIVGFYGSGDAGMTAHSIYPSQRGNVSSR